MEPKPPSSRRPRRPLQPGTETEDTDEPPSGQLQIQQDTTQAGRVCLELQGILDLETVGALRDAAFTVIGSRPALLLIDTTLLGPLDIAGIETLNTIGRVANLVKVRFSVRVGKAEHDIFDKTGLNRLMTIEVSE